MLPAILIRRQVLHVHVPCRDCLVDARLARYVERLPQSLFQTLKCVVKIERAALFELDRAVQLGVGGWYAAADDGMDQSFPLVGAEPGCRYAGVGDVEDGNGEGLKRWCWCYGEVYYLRADVSIEDVLGSLEHADDIPVGL